MKPGMKPIRIELDFPTLVFLMKSRRNLYVHCSTEEQPPIELILAKGEHPGSMGDAIRLVEEEWGEA